MISLFKSHKFLEFPSSANRIEKRKDWCPENQTLFVVEKLSGLVFTRRFKGSFDLSEAAPNNLTLSDIGDAFGEWMAVCSTRGLGEEQHVVFSDFFGLAPVYYSFIPGRGIIISDSYSGVASAYQSRIGQLSLNEPNYLSLLPNWIGIYLAASCQENTMSNEIKLLLPTEALVITSNSVRIIDRMSLSSASRIEDPEALIERGIEESTSMLAYLSQSSEMEKRIRLSGGNDSRMALSLMAAAGVTQEFRVQTTDPRPIESPAAREMLEKDMRISDELRRRYGMAWATPYSGGRIRLSFEETIRSYCDYQSQLSPEFFTQSPVRLLPHEPILTMVGAGGEIMRQAAAASYIPGEVFGSVAEAEALPPNEQIQRIVDWSLQRLAIPASLKAVSHAYLKSAFERAGGASLRERLTNFNFLTSYRCHFGNGRLFTALNQPQISVLNNAHFVKASQFMSIEERASDQFTRKLLEKTDPKLLDVVFENESTTKNVSSPTAVNPRLNAWIPEYDNATSNQSRVTDMSVKSGPARQWRTFFDPKQQGQAYLSEGFDEIERLTKHSKDAGWREFHDRLLEHGRVGSLHQNWLVFKTACALEGFYPQNAEQVFLDSDVPPRDSSLKGEINVSNAIRDGWNDADLIRIQPQAVASGGLVIVSLQPQVAASDSYEYAAYLMEDGRKLFSQGYQDQPNFIFEVDNLDGRNLSIIGFARRRPGARPHIVRDIQVKIQGSCAALD